MIGDCVCLCVCVYVHACVNRYRDIDDSVAMESSYAQQEYEESRR